MEHACRFGIEEEYFLSEAGSRGIAQKVPKPFFAEAKRRFPDKVQQEMLQSQIEIATPVCADMAEARQVLSRLRTGLAGLALEHDLLLLACGTHPSAVWARQRVTEAARYDKIKRDLQMIGSRNQFCGLHVHVEVPDEDGRIGLMRRITPYLPLLLALSTSSPFWQGRRTGLMGYRLAAYAELPRTGIPEFFDDAEDYRRYIATMVASGAIKDASFLWWTIRPSQNHPTLELRIADSCTRIEDTLAIVGLFRCLVRYLLRHPKVNVGLTGASRALAIENLWRAQRYGIHGGLISETSQTMRPCAELLEELLADLQDDIVALGCEREIATCRTIATEGTSADLQLAIFEEARQRGGDAAGLSAVVDWIASETRLDGQAGQATTRRASG